MKTIENYRKTLGTAGREMAPNVVCLETAPGAVVSNSVHWCATLRQRHEPIHGYLCRNVAVACQAGRKYGGSDKINVVVAMSRASDRSFTRRDQKVRPTVSRLDAIYGKRLNVCCPSGRRLQSRHDPAVTTALGVIASHPVPSCS